MGNQKLKDTETETQTFTDTKGRTWDLTITVDAIKRVRQLGDLDLLGIIDVNASLVDKLTTDPILLVDTIYLVIKPQADDRDVSDEDFGRAMAGDAIAAATMALLRSIADFFDSPRKRKMIHKILDAAVQVSEKTAEIVAGRLDQQLPQIVQQVLNTFDVASIESQEPSPAGEGRNG